MKRSELIKEYLEAQKKYRELDFALSKNFLPTINRLREKNDLEGLKLLLDKCPDSNAKFMIYYALREVRER